MSQNLGKNPDRYFSPKVFPSKIMFYTHCSSKVEQKYSISDLNPLFLSKESFKINAPIPYCVYSVIKIGRGKKKKWR